MDVAGRPSAFRLHLLAIFYSRFPKCISAFIFLYHLASVTHTFANILTLTFAFQLSSHSHLHLLLIVIIIMIKIIITTVQRRCFHGWSAMKAGPSGNSYIRPLIGASFSLFSSSFPLFPFSFSLFPSLLPSPLFLESSPPIVTEILII